MSRPFLLPTRNQYAMMAPMQILTDDQIAENIAANLAHFLQKRKINQSELGRRSGTCRMMVSRYIRGQMLPSAGALSRLAAALRTTPNRLLATPSEK